MKRRVSTFLCALAAFLSVNVALSFFAPVHFNPFNYPYKGWAWWTFNDLKTSTEVHNVAILGSSLMVAAINNCDANYLNRPLNLTQHHQSIYLNDQLEKTFGGKFRSYNLSAPGQMPSDAYLTLKAMLSTAHRPDVVVYGVAPRDFCDSQMGSPTDTEPFHFLTRLVSTDDCSGGLFRDPFGKLSWFIDRNLYFAHHAIDWQMLTDRWGSRILAKAAPLPSGSKAYDFWQRCQLLPAYKPGEIHPNAVITNPITQEAAIANFKDNTGEYVERYKKVDRHTFDTQLYFLGKIASLCKKERVELVLVNMPITKENINVLGATTYLDYVSTLKQKAFAKGYTFFDLNYFYLYNTDIYCDYVHLNAFGGAKFVDSLVSALNTDPRTRLTMQMAGRELWKQSELAKLASPLDSERDSLEELKLKLEQNNILKGRSKINQIIQRRQIGGVKPKSVQDEADEDVPGVAM